MTAGAIGADAASLRVLLVGNYAADGQYSMRLFGRTLHEGLRARGVDADLIEPTVSFGRWAREKRSAKLAGYIDKYVIFPLILRRMVDRYDCVHILDQSNAPYRAVAGRKPVVVTCHDLFAVQIMLGEVPGERFGTNGTLLQKSVLANLRRADAFTCVSAHSAAELVRITGTHAPVDLIPNALSPVFAPVGEAETVACMRSLGLDPGQPFFLHVGGNQFYKNRVGVVRVFGRLAGHDAFARHRLVLVGKAPDEALTAELAASPVNDRIDIAVAPEDAAVRALYSRATALLFLSTHEGFGWPIIEAQACGCVVVTTDSEPMRSVAGEGALLVDPADVEGAAWAIATALPRFASLRDAGRRNAASFNPDRIYPRYRDVYVRAVAAGSGRFRR